jgi:hypothetical protein
VNGKGEDDGWWNHEDQKRKEGKCCSAKEGEENRKRG